MCGGRRTRANRCSARYNSPLVTSAMPITNHHNEKGINQLIGAVHNIALNSTANQPQYTNQVPAYPEDYKMDSKDAPPSYERVVGLGPEVITREMTRSTVNTMPKETMLPSKMSAASPQVERLVEGLTTALASYNAGSGRRWHVKKAQRALRNELYEVEVERRTAMYGRLRCGERCEIWREIKAMNLGY